jgi:glycosyltransferase involved in cell wall biosynthesis
VKVAITTLNENPDRPTGMLSYFLQLGKYLPQKAPDDEFILICDPRDVALYKERCPDATCVGIGTGNRNRRKRLLTEHFLLRSYLDKAGVDVLLHTGVGVAPLLMPHRTALALSIIATHHLTAGHIRLSARIYRSLMVGRSIRKADTCIVNSRYTLDSLMAVYPQVAEKAAIIHHGVDSALFHPGELTEAEGAVLAGLGVRRPFVLFVGKIYRYKMLHVAVEAFGRAMAATGLPHQMVVVGSFAEEHGLGENYRQSIMESTRRHGVEDRLLLLDNVGVKALRGLYAGADVYIQSSAGETFGRTVLEAMACGCPVLAANAASTPEILADAGTYYETENVEQCAACLQALLLDEPARASSRQKGLARAQGFSFEAEVDTMLAVLRKTAAAKAV